MHTIEEAKTLAPAIKLIKVRDLDAARAAKPGQFCVIKIDKNGERIPLTIAEADTDSGLITVIFQEAGATTTLLGQLKKGDVISDFLCPLGTLAHIAKLGTVVTIGGGVGIPEILPVTKAFKEAGNYVVSILGARTKELILLEDKIRGFSNETLIATDDGFGKRVLSPTF